MAEKRRKWIRRLVKLVLYAELGALMFISKVLLEWAPNIHLVGVLVVIYTLAFRVEALIPIYVFAFASGFLMGFAPWWYPYLYVWTVLWAVVMILPKKLPPKIAIPVYMVVCALHGLLFGVLYAPVQTIVFSYNFEQILVWIAAGFWFDVVHAIGNFCLGVTIYPVSQFLLKMKAKYIDSI